MAEMQDDVCLVCAEPLLFTAFGACGHKEVCSKCVARMRFVLKDRGCVFCRQENTQVLFTRFMGDYTSRLAPEDFDKLQARVASRELFALPEIDGFFDDEAHLQTIRTLCGFTHPVLETSGRAGPKFNDFTSLKRHIESTCSQFFCDICVKGRKIFLSEQMLYNKDALRRHQETGDESGPLAESGFKGHPACKFCRTRFFDSSELYRHMESSHEHCFLCRRAAPDKYVYYRHYKELEDHFTKDHHPCPHPSCLEKKFVVYDTEYELKAHFANEHGDELKMSASQRRQALTIPMQLQYRSRDDEATERGANARLERAAVVIGGGYNLSGGNNGGGGRTSRSGRDRDRDRGGRGGGMHHSRSEPQFAQPGTSGTDAPELSSVTFTAEDFPAPASAQQSAAGALGRWAAYAGSQAATGRINQQDFPELPTLSKNQRRRIKDQQRTLADRLSTAAQPPRVLNRAAPAPSSGAGPSSSGQQHQSMPAAGDFPALSTAPPAPVAPRSPAPARAPSPEASTAAAAAAASRSSNAPAATASGNRRPPGFGQEAFPALGGGGGKAKGKAPAPPFSPPPPSSAYSGVASGLSPPPPAALSQAAVLNSLFMRPGSAAATTGSASTSAAAGFDLPLASDSAAQLGGADFPSLPPGSKPAGGKSRAAQGAGKAAKGGGKASSPAAAKPQSAAQGSAASGSGGAGPSGSGGGGGVSDSLKAANRGLVERIKRQLSGAAFDTFRQQSMLFMRGELAAEEYHDYMVSLGLLSLVAELVSLCPDAAKRRLLLDVHRAFICSPAAQDPGLVGAGWMPPEAAFAKADRVAQHSSWACRRCGLSNAPDDADCEACGGLRPTEEQQLQQQPPHFSAASAAAAAAPGPSSSYGGLQLNYGLRSAEAAEAASSRQQGGSSSKAAPAAGPAPPAAADFPSLPLAPARGGGADLARAESSGLDDAFGGVSGGKGKKGKGSTFKIGLPTTSASGTGGAGGRTHPQNVWTQPKFRAGNQWTGPGGNKLAKMHGAVNDAWD